MRKEEQPIVPVEKLAFSINQTARALDLLEKERAQTEALQAEIERLKGERDRWEKHATTGDGVIERTRAKLTTAESEASVLRKRVNESVRGEDWENAAHELLWKAGLTTLFDKLSARAKQEAAARAAIAKAEGGNNAG